MSLRDYFVAHAPEPPTWWLREQKGGNMVVLGAEWAGQWADARMAERDKEVADD